MRNIAIALLCLLPVVGLGKPAGIGLAVHAGIPAAQRIPIRRVEKALWSRTSIPRRDDVTWYDAGWIDCVKLSDTNATIKILFVSNKQTRGIATSTKFTEWREDMKDIPGMRMGAFDTFKELLITWGLRRKHLEIAIPGQ